MGGAHRREQRPDPGCSPTGSPPPGHDPVTARTYRHLYLSALRYDVRCATLQALAEPLTRSEHRPLDCYSRALYAFALLGQSRPEGLAVVDQVLDETGDHATTLHVLLHGLWLGVDLDQGAQRLLALSARPPFAADTDPVVAFRRAGALRRLGRYEASLATVDHALGLLPPGDTTVHADLVRAQSLTATARDLHHRSLVLGGTPT
ncbi:hypothetical protein [Streptomyces sp. NPDC047042]|uniref:hypothetical protein n=1 Tax=Streptomyces sp. NPDC047042 TaxID=3154807 RepID=UPI0033F4A11C